MSAKIITLKREKLSESTFQMGKSVGLGFKHDMELFLIRSIVQPCAGYYYIT